MLDATCQRCGATGTGDNLQSLKLTFAHETGCGWKIGPLSVKSTTHVKETPVEKPAELKRAEPQTDKPKTTSDTKTSKKTVKRKKSDE